MAAVRPQEAGPALRCCGLGEAVTFATRGDAKAVCRDEGLIHRGSALVYGAQSRCPARLVRSTLARRFSNTPQPAPRVEAGDGVTALKGTSSCALGAAQDRRSSFTPRRTAMG